MGADKVVKLLICLIEIAVVLVLLYSISYVVLSAVIK